MIVTGTSSGLGKNLVEELLISGYKVAATSRKASSLSSLSSTNSPSRLLVLELDVTSPAEIKSAFQRTKSHFGRIDVVVNNAGYGLKGEVEAISDELARYQMEINYWGPVNISREVC